MSTITTDIVTWGSNSARGRAQLEYTTSSTNTSYTVKWTLRAQSAYSYGTKVTATLSGADSGTASGTATSSQMSSSWVTVGSKSDSITFSKGHSSATKTFTIKVANAANSTTKTKSMTVTVPARKSYTITYNANGGSGAPTASTKYYGETLTLKSTKPTKTGYTFVGWSTSKTATTATYSAGGSYTANASAELFAIWKKTLTLSFNSNGGQGTVSSLSKTIYNATTTATFTLPAGSGFSREGYKFIGWYNSTSPQTILAPGTSYTVSANTTLYAQWEGGVLLEYDPNCDDEVSNFPVTQYADEPEPGETVTFRISNLTPTRELYSFSSWETSGGDSYSPSDSISVSDDTVLYAQWTQSKWKVHYDLNGGIMETPPSDSLGNINSSITAAAKPSATNGNLVAIGWNTKADGTGTSYNFEGAVPYSNGTTVLTLYLVWQAQIDFVNYDEDIIDFSPQSIRIAVGNSILLSTCTGSTSGGITYTCRTWADEDGNYYEAGTYLPIEESLELEAVWSYSVTYLDGTDEFEEYALKNQPYIIIEPTAAGFTSDQVFVEWNIDSTGISTSYNPGEEITDSALTLYAIWGYQITFDLNGGTGEVSSIAGKEGATVNVPNNVPTIAGYSFKGWSTNEAGTLPVGLIQPGAETQIGSSDSTLYAQYYYTVSFNLNGGSDSGSSSNPVSVDKGSGYTVQTSSTIKKTGFVFENKWTYNGVTYGPNVTGYTVVPEASGNKTLVASYRTYNAPAGVVEYCRRYDSSLVEPEDGTDVELVVNCTFDSQTIANQHSVVVSYKESGTSGAYQTFSGTPVWNNTHTQLTYTSTNANLETTKSYQIKIAITDNTNGDSLTTEIFSFISTSYFTLDFGSQGYGIGVGTTAPEIENPNKDNAQLDIGMNIYIDGSPVVDFIIEQGTETESGNTWTYRKWKSGKVEAWANPEVTLTSATARGNVYSSSFSLTIPSGIFSSTPNLVITTIKQGKTSGSWSYETANFSVVSSASSATNINCRLYRYSTITDSTDIKLNVYIIS